MIAGLSGDLLSSAYLDTHVAGQMDTAPPHLGTWMRDVVRWWRRARGALGPATAPRAMLDIGAHPLLAHLDLVVSHVEGHPWGHAGVLTHDGQPVATLIAVTWGTTAAGAWRRALRSHVATRLPWALVFNGRELFVVDASRPWARRFIGFEFTTASRDARALTALRSLVSGRALLGGAGGVLGRAIASSEAAGAEVCDALGRGVLVALQALMRDLGATPRALHRDGDDRRVFEQSLTVVYRLLFLLFAEAQHLVPIWHQLYHDGYSMASLCDRLIANPRARGTWPAVQAMARLAHAGCEAEELRVTAFNGRLFAPSRTPLAEQRRVMDATAAEAVLAIGTTRTPRGRARVAFRDLGVEQLGAVYERVLDFEPIRHERTLRLRATSAERKTTGSFYTPRVMTDFLVRRTLGPLVEGRSAEAILSLRVLDPAMGSGAFLVAACRFLTDRVEQAHLSEGTWNEGEVTHADRAETSRQVAERCLFGVDRNPTAVQLARLSLWLTTLAADRPLTFLDHHLAAGNSLVGARLCDLSAPPSAATARADGSQLSLFGEEALRAWGRHVVPERLRLALDRSDSPAAVHAKERRHERLTGAEGPLSAWMRAADLWCGLALQPGRISPGLYADLQRHVAGSPTAMPARELASRAAPLLEAARAQDTVHWELLFPEVFFAADGSPRADAGFDAVIGNPPWEVLRADTGADTVRSIARAQLDAAMRFIRASGRYDLHTSGHVNQYQLFLERTMQLLGPGGRFGLILPAGLQWDMGSAGLRRALLDGHRLDTWIGFDNRRAIFPIHRSVRFLLVAGTSGSRTEAVPALDAGSEVSCLSRLPDAARDTDAAGPRVAISRVFIDRWDPVHLSMPQVSTPLAMAVATRALDAPALGAESGWGVRFGRELNASDDRREFVARSQAGTRGVVPVVEGKHLRPFAIDVADATGCIARARADARLGSRWRVPRVCYREVASSTNRLTLMAAVLPPGIVSTHTLFCAKTRLDDTDAQCLVSLLNSLVANYLVRLQMTTHVTAGLMERLPVPRPRPGTPAHTALAHAARELSVHGSIDEAPACYATLNAEVARLYGLTRDEYTHVVSTFPLLPESLRALCAAIYARPSSR